MVPYSKSVQLIKQLQLGIKNAMILYSPVQNRRGVVIVGGRKKSKVKQPGIAINGGW